ncbi:hypothetical protein [Algoriphagus vanfongensis]|uniref:hypothetical protein n=1 Tax=Algoriphagus vanfongensis TaxID=426371 RepID=UPI000478C284|nr:hypothetical protein [Algoriphagus vanfongensis]
MIVQVSNATFLIENCSTQKSCFSIKSDSMEELLRLFGSSKNIQFVPGEYPYQVNICRQEFSNSLILLIKEIDYTNFSKLATYC